MLHCLHKEFLSIRGELGTGDLICSSVQPKADLLVFTCFPVTYRRRWHLHPHGALTLSTTEQVVLVLLRLLLNTRYPSIKAKAAQSDLGAGKTEILPGGWRIRAGLLDPCPLQKAWSWIYQSGYCQRWQQAHLLQVLSLSHPSSS